MYNSGEYIKECDIFLEMQYYFIDISHILAFYSQIPRHVPLHMLRHTSSKGQRSKVKVQISTQCPDSKQQRQDSKLFKATNTTPILIGQPSIIKGERGNWNLYDL